MEETSYNDFRESQVVPLDLKGNSPEAITNLQMVLVTSSMNHEYARQEYEQEKSYERRQQLLTRMEDLKTLYFRARKGLEEFSPEKLEQIEEDLLFQKQAVLNEFPI